MGAGKDGATIYGSGLEEGNDVPPESLSRLLEFMPLGSGRCSSSRTLREPASLLCRRLRLWSVNAHDVN